MEKNQPSTEENANKQNQLYKEPVKNNVKYRLLDILAPSVKNGFEAETNINEFEIIKKIGEGSFGVVFKVKYKQTGAIYAIKVLDKNDKKSHEGKSYFKREIEIMYKIRHPNIVRLYTHFEDDHYCYFVMDFVPKGNLYQIIEKQKRKCFDSKTVANYLKDLLSAVYYLHNMNPIIIHRDIKLENILVDESGRLKLTDFGWSNYICDDEVRDTFCGTPIYQSPEMIQRKEHDHNVDIWCLGVIMFELIAGKVPFDTTSKSALQQSILKLQIKWPSDFPPIAQDLISKILKLDPKERIQIESMFKHHFFLSQINNMQQYLIKPSFDDQTDIFLISKQIPSNRKRSSNLSKKQIESFGRTDTLDEDKETEIKVELENLKILFQDQQEELTTIKEENKSLIKENKSLKSELENEKNEIMILKERIEKLESLKTPKYFDPAPLEDINENQQKENDFIFERSEKSLNLDNQNSNEYDEEILHTYDRNTKNITNFQNKIRESIRNLNKENEISYEIEKIKFSVNQDLIGLKNMIIKEKQKYETLQNENIRELEQLSLENKQIKESTAKSFDIILKKYEQRLQQKEKEIKELHILLNKNK